MSSEIPNNSRDGGSGTPGNTDLTNLPLTLKNQLKEKNERIEKISGISPVIKGVDMETYLQQSWKLSVAPLPILKKLKISGIPKYNETLNPRDHVTTFSTGVKGYDLTKQ